MLFVLPWLAIILGLVGNCGFWLFCFNRVNAFGFPRPVAKMAEKVCIFLCFAIPSFLFWIHADSLPIWLSSGSFWPPATAPGIQWWLALSLAALFLIGPFWLESRLWLIPPKHLLVSHEDRYEVHHELPGGSTHDVLTKFWACLPMNDWAALELSRKRLLLPRSVPGAEGLTIAHLSDLHFTGQYRVEHYQFALARMMEHKPEMIVISGDIIDFQHCMPMVRSVLGSLTAPLGVFFVLGNHERRLKNIRALLGQLEELGFIDLGRTDHQVNRQDLAITLRGNESPWFHRHVNRHRKPKKGASVRKTGKNNGRPSVDAHHLKIGVSHSPDQIEWARAENIDLLLAGHTHGGQARIPGIGPIVAPSFYGSKFASGVFHLPPTLMHVSRGVAGTHTVRWRCPPEISILTLCNDESAAGGSPHKS